MAQWGKASPSAQVMVSGSWDRAPALGSLLSGEPTSLSLSFSLSLLWVHVLF